MLRLIIKIFLIVFLIYFLHKNPLPIPCFCEGDSFFTRCIEGSKLDEKTCAEIAKVVESIDESFKVIARNIISITDTLSKDIPTIPTNIPKVSNIVSEKYTNYTINNIPEIPTVNMSCPINIPLSNIMKQTNKAITDMNNDLNAFGRQFNNSQFVSGLNNVISQLENIKSAIDTIKIGGRFGFNLLLSCGSGYTLTGLSCVPNPPNGYVTRPGDIVNYWLDQPTSYLMGTARTSNQDNSACNGLRDVLHGVGSCTGTDPCNSKTPVVTTKLCKSCTYDNYTWGCDAGRCGCEREETKCCDRGIKTRICNIYRCYWSYSWGCQERSECGSNCTVAKCCNNGIKTTLTGVNCDKCGTYDSTTGGDCIAAVVTRNAPRTCPDGTEFDDLKALCYPTCKNGYHKNPGDVVSCWNNNPTTKPININDVKIPSLQLSIT